METRVVLTHDVDIVEARQEGRKLAEALGFGASDVTMVATAISEIARNIVVYASEGEIVIQVLEDGRRRGIEVIGRDHGPGIQDVGLAMQDGFSTGGSLGLGLPGARRLMDEFQIESQIGRGTTVRMRKWLK